MGIKYQIVIEIDEDENVEMETFGFKGPDCMKELKKITKNIGTINSERKTKEYYEQSTTEKAKQLQKQKK
jgi:ribosomal protein S21